MESEDESHLYEELAPLRIPLEDIVNATTNFADDNLIKRGGISDVYKRQLLRSAGPIKVAVRRFRRPPPCPPIGEHSFLKEIMMLSSIKHKNFVPFVGFCDENGEMMMIFEYAVNGSLDQHLSDLTLTWSQRLNICLGVASALEYILEINDQYYLHHDIRSSKILLDKDWEPMLFCFGFHIPSDVVFYKTTIYTDPYFLEKRHSTDHSDVYSLGVILFEVLSGRKAVLEEGGAYESLLSLIENENPELIIDPNLKKQMHDQQISLFIFSETAFDSLKKNYSINQVVDRLKVTLEAHLTEKILEEDFSYLKIPLCDIKLATKTFSKTYSIGSKVHGTVYKAELDHFDHQTFSSSEGKNKDTLPKTRSAVIIKRFEDWQYQERINIFLAEIEMLTSCKNPNIVSLVGFYWDPSEMILIYEGAFISLHEYLQSTSQPHLRWEQRIRICQDIMHALKNLFNNIEPYELKERINSENVLLDDKGNAKIPSFIFPFQLSTSMTEPLDWWTNYTYSQIFNSIGEIFFEILTGRLMRSVYFIREDYFDQGKLKDSIDPRLMEEVQENSFILRKGPRQDSLEAFSNITYKCLADYPSKPPTLEEVIESLEKALQCQMQNFDHLKIPLADIKLVTGEFDKGKKIASGGYGDVYKGELYHFDVVKYPFVADMKNKNELPKKLSTVAIKHIKNARQGKEGFLTELEVLCKYKHPNIVSLVGFCIEGPEMILVYEFASNGSLDDYLEKTPKEANFTWVQRLNMCIEIAQGLQFLHTTYMEDLKTIIHRDIKSANILLGDNWEAKIADFGLSKVHFANQQESIIHTKFAGTEVYTDPEYIKTNKLKKESDIYSLGVVLFEILSGTVAYHSNYTNENIMGLAPVIRRRIKEGTLNEIIDSEIMDEAHTLSATLKIGPDQNSLRTFTKIAHQCLEETQSKRPSIQMVIAQLQKALKFQKNRKYPYTISLEDIQWSTESVGDNNCIIRGEFGMIYNGQIQRKNGKENVAVKRFSRCGPECGFIRELEVLFKHEHDNIIRLVGCCKKLNEEIIVYEHASNGSLDRYLQDPSFTWTQRLKICADIAKGLNFLHGGDGQKKDVVIHRNIKSSNILLTRDWKAKFCGFELSLISPINQEIKYVKNDVVGSPGYCDPLYWERGFLTKESDIYSFGVVLFEVLCGRLACPENFRDKSQFLDNLVQRHYEVGRLDEIVFEGIKGQIALKSLATFRRIAFQCLHGEREERPTADEVAVQLQNALKFQEEYDNDVVCSTDKKKENIGILLQEGNTFSTEGNIIHVDAPSEEGRPRRNASPRPIRVRNEGEQEVPFQVNESQRNATKEHSKNELKFGKTQTEEKEPEQKHNEGAESEHGTTQGGEHLGRALIIPPSLYKQVEETMEKDCSENAADDNSTEKEITIPQTSSQEPCTSHKDSVVGYINKIKNLYDSLVSTKNNLTKMILTAKYTYPQDEDLQSVLENIRNNVVADLKLRDFESIHMEETKESVVNEITNEFLKNKNLENPSENANTSTSVVNEEDFKTLEGKVNKSYAMIPISHPSF